MPTTPEPMGTAEPAVANAPSTQRGNPRSLRRKSRRLGDPLFRGLCTAFAAGIVALVAAMVLQLVQGSSLALSRFGFGFLTGHTWDPVAGDFGAATFVYGTLATSVIALALAVPFGVGIAIFLSELAPRKLRAPIGFLVELLAAIPSVVYGLWGLFVLAPLVRAHIAPALRHTLGFLPWFSGESYGVGVLTAGMLLAIMVLPFVAAVSRDVLASVPRELRDASLALGATQWETIWRVVLPSGRAGISGATILALGRALGETMAVTMVIGNTPQIARSLFAPGYTMSSVIANEFAEASGPLYLAALTEIGLWLFIVTFTINGAARVLIWRATLPVRARAR